MKAYATVLLPVIVLAAAAGVQGGTSMNPSPHAPAETSDGKLESLFTAVLQYRHGHRRSASRHRALVALVGKLCLPAHP